MRRYVLAVWTVTASLLALQTHGAETHPFALSNDWIQVKGDGFRITHLAVDPAGYERWRAIPLEVLTPTALSTDTATRYRQDRDGVAVSDVRVDQPVTLKMPEGRRLPWDVSPGQRMVQEFEVPAGMRLQRVEVRVATHHTTDSSLTLRLRDTGRTGRVLLEQRFGNVQDNSTIGLDVPADAPKQLALELADVEGRIAVWGPETPEPPGGSVWLDDQPAHRSFDLTLRLLQTRARADVDIQLEDKALVLRVKFRTGFLEPAPGGHRWVMSVPWNNSGYDTSAAAVPFMRFFSDDFRYMSVHQLKRWYDTSNEYGHGVTGRQWIEADGTGAADLRFEAPSVSMNWRLKGRSTDMLITAGARSPGSVEYVLRLRVLPRQDNLPDGWPRFRFADAALTRDANTFLYERLFSFGTLWGSAVWQEWNCIGREWCPGNGREALATNIARIAQAEDGYIHTWGALAGWPFPDPEVYDTRHFDTNARFILAVRHHYLWTGDREFLRSQADRIRKAMDYQLDTLGGTSGLIITASKDVNGRHRGIGNNYWDITPYGHLDAYANIVWYASVAAMAELEAELSRMGVAGGRPSSAYQQMLPTIRNAYTVTFWDDTAGRFIQCVDIDGKRHDYGATYLNLEAIAYGLANDQQAQRIWRWLDSGVTHSGQADIYSRWIFAPRATTVHNPRWDPATGKKIDDVPGEPWWHMGWLGKPWEQQCQDGGAILFTSFFDLLARTRTRGPDNAWRRWTEILGRWRLPDHLCGGGPLYRGEQPQQVLDGAVGVDVPFPESGLVPGWILYGLLGVQATPEGLVIEPCLPSSQPFVEAHNVRYGDSNLFIRVDRKAISVRAVSPTGTRRYATPMRAGARVLIPMR